MSCTTVHEVQAYYCDKSNIKDVKCVACLNSYDGSDDATKRQCKGLVNGDFECVKNAKNSAQNYCRSCIDLDESCKNSDPPTTATLKCVWGKEYNKESSSYTCRKCAEVDPTRPVWDPQEKICWGCVTKYDPICTSKNKLCNTETHRCTDAECGENSSYNSTKKKCVCKTGYIVLGNDKKCSESSAPGKIVNKKCSSRTMNFTTANGVKYEVKFTEVSVDDWAKFECDGVTKKWCSNNYNTSYSDAYCSSEARATKILSSQNFEFTGKGGNCTFSVINGHGDEEKTACTGTVEIKVKDAVTEYEPW